MKCIAKVRGRAVYANCLTLSVLAASGVACSKKASPEELVAAAKAADAKQAADDEAKQVADRAATYPLIEAALANVATSVVATAKGLPHTPVCAKPTPGPETAFFLDKLQAAPLVAASAFAKPFSQTMADAIEHMPSTSADAVLGSRAFTHVGAFATHTTAGKTSIAPEAVATAKRLAAAKFLVVTAVTKHVRPVTDLETHTFTAGSAAADLVIVQLPSGKPVCKVSVTAETERTVQAQTETANFSIDDEMMATLERNGEQKLATVWSGFKSRD